MTAIVLRNASITGMVVSLVAALIVGILPSMAQTNGEPTPETIVAPDSFPTRSKVEILPWYFDATKFNNHYTALMEHTKLADVDREVAILVIEILNKLNATVTSRFSDIGVYSGSMRLYPVICLFDEVGKGKIPTYQLVDAKEFNVHSGQRLRIHLVFIVRPGEDIYVANSSVYTLFKHASVEGLPFSVSIGHSVEAPEVEDDETKPVGKPDASDETSGTFGNNGAIPPPPPPPPPPEFAIAPQVTSDSIFRVKRQSFSLLAEAPGLSVPLGDRGRQPTDLIFLGVPLAIKDSDFDYISAINYLDEFYDYHESHRDVERSIIWLPKYRLLFSAINGKALFGVEVHGPITTPTDVACALLFIGTLARDLGIDKTHLAPIKYVEHDKGFSVECLGIHVEGVRQGNVYTLDLYKKDSSGARENNPFKNLKYVRPF